MPILLTNDFPVCDSGSSPCLRVAASQSGPGGRRTSDRRRLVVRCQRRRGAPTATKTKPASCPQLQTAYKELWKCVLHTARLCENSAECAATVMVAYDNAAALRLARRRNVCRSGWWRRLSTCPSLIGIMIWNTARSQICYR